MESDTSRAKGDRENIQKSSYIQHKSFYTGGGIPNRVRLNPTDEPWATRAEKGLSARGSVCLRDGRRAERSESMLFEGTRES